MAQRPWNNCAMKGMVPTLQRHQVLLLKVAFVFSFHDCKCSLAKRTTMTDSYGCIVVLYDYGVNRYILNKYLGMQGEY